jgi:hypothetical protein
MQQMSNIESPLLGYARGNGRPPRPFSGQRKVVFPQPPLLACHGTVPVLAEKGFHRGYGSHAQGDTVKGRRPQTVQAPPA